MIAETSVLGWMLLIGGEAASEGLCQAAAVWGLVLADLLGDRGCRSPCSGSGVGDRLERAS